MLNSPPRLSCSPEHSRHHARRGVAFVLLLLLRSAAFAQTTTGAIEGLVTGPDGKPLADIVVVATMPATQIVRSGVTTAEGMYRITALQLGEYEVAIQAPGYQPITVKPVLVRLGRTTAVPAVQLTPQKQLVEQVEVRGKPPIIDPVSTTAGGSLTAGIFDNLPVTRDYLSIAALLPNVSVSYLGDGVNIAGASGFENRYFVDGIDMTQGHNGSVGTSLPPDFIQEVQVKTAGYEAEYRSALGGVVNVVTPSGSNQLAGKFMAYWTSDLVSGETKQSPADLERTDFTQYDVGFTLSGPLVRDKAWYFVAFDPEFTTVDKKLPGLGSFQDSSTAYRYSGKLNWQANPTNNIVLTLVGDPLQRDGVGDFAMSFGYSPTSFLNPDPYLRDISSGGNGAALRGTHILSSRWLLESSLSGQWYAFGNLPATERGNEEILFIDATTGTWSGGSSAWTDWKNRQLAAAAAATVVLDQHELKFGAEYRDNETTLDSFHWQSLAKTGDTTFVLDQGGIGTATVGNRTLTAFAQDSWRIGSRWTLNVGLRWGQEKLRNGMGTVVQTIDNEWQPRLGFVYQPGRLGTQRLYGSAARYYQELSTMPVAMAKQGGTWDYCVYDHDPRFDPTGGYCLGGSWGNFPETDDLRGNHFDEYSLGYELQFNDRHRGGIRALYRTLGDVVEDGMLEGSFDSVWGNPGRGELSHYPEATRTYEALELTVQGRPTDRSGYFASYVYSENRGNYPGMFNQDFYWPAPNSGGTFGFPFMVDEGLLPNDRPHVFKASGFYLLPFNLNVGASILWQSGTPLNEFGGSPVGPPYYIFLQPRGTAGRTPSIFSMNLRVDYTFTGGSLGRWRPRLILDVYNLFSSGEPFTYDQVRYFNQDADGNQINPNPTYGDVTVYYPPTTARLGIEVSF